MMIKLCYRYYISSVHGLGLIGSVATWAEQKNTGFYDPLVRALATDHCRATIMRMVDLFGVVLLEQSKEVKEKSLMSVLAADTMYPNWRSGNLRTISRAVVETDDSGKLKNVLDGECKEWEEQCTYITEDKIQELVKAERKRATRAGDRNRPLLKKSKGKKVFSLYVYFLSAFFLLVRFGPLGLVLGVALMIYLDAKGIPAALLNELQLMIAEKPKVQPTIYENPQFYPYGGEAQLYAFNLTPDEGDEVIDLMLNHGEFNMSSDDAVAKVKGMKDEGGGRGGSGVGGGGGGGGGGPPGPPSPPSHPGPPGPPGGGKSYSGYPYAYEPPPNIYPPPPPVYGPGYHHSSSGGFPDAYGPSSYYQP